MEETSAPSAGVSFARAQDLQALSLLMDTFFLIAPIVGLLILAAGES